MKISSVGLAAVVCLALGACASTVVQDKENMLSAAGFHLRVADTPAKVASLKSLPPHKFTVQTQNGQPVYLYADPTVCGCIYYGTEDNYGLYQQMMFQQRLANQQQMTAMMNQQMAFDYGPWGGPFMPMY